MSNGESAPVPEDRAPGATEPTGARKARAIKKATPKKRTAKVAVATTPTVSAVVRKTPAKRSGRTTRGYTRVQVGQVEMFVSRDVAAAMTDKDLNRLRSVFKRIRKRARKRAAKKKR